MSENYINLEDLPPPEEAESQEDLEFMVKKFAQTSIPVSVHSVEVKGNSKTKTFVIEAQLKRLKNATTSRDLLREAALVVNSIERTGLFEKCIILLEEGPTEGSLTVVVNVEEASRPWLVDLAGFTDHHDKENSFQGIIKLRNVLGLGEIWHVAGHYDFNEECEVTTGLLFPMLKELPSSVTTQTSFSAPDWLKLSTYKVRLTGITVGIFSNEHHDLRCGLSRNNLQLSSDAFGMIPSVKYAFKIDKRDCRLRPTRGFAFRLASQVSGFGLDMQQYQARQDVDFRFGIPLGFCNAALNFGLSGGFMLPWTKDYSRKASIMNGRFFMGRHSSLVCGMNGPSTVLGMTKLEEAENNTQIPESKSSFGGSLAFSGFADLSFDLPIAFMKKQNVYGHCFVCAGNQIGLTEEERQSFNVHSLLQTSKCFAGVGIVVPTRALRVEVNICQALGRSVNNKRGIQLSFSSLCHE